MLGCWVYEVLQGGFLQIQTRMGKICIGRFCVRNGVNLWIGVTAK